MTRHTCSQHTSKHTHTHLLIQERLIWHKNSSHKCLTQVIRCVLPDKQDMVKVNILVLPFLKSESGRRHTCATCLTKAASHSWSCFTGTVEQYRLFRCSKQLPAPLPWLNTEAATLPVKVQSAIQISSPRDVSLTGIILIYGYTTSCLFLSITRQHRYVRTFSKLFCSSQFMRLGPKNWWPAVTVSAQILNSH